MGVGDSDHKPVFCSLDVALPAFDQDACRAAALAAIAGAAAGAGAEARLALAPGTVRLGAARGHAAVATLTNGGGVAAAFVVAGGGAQPGGALPAWLDVSPCAGVLPPGGAVELRLRGSPQPAQWGEVGPPPAAEVLVAGAPAGGGGGAWPAGVLESRAGCLSLIVTLA